MSHRRFAPWLPVLVGFLALSIGAQAQDARPLDKAQLEQLAAPIALYPDALLSQVLMASTYPTEVVEAARWSRDNPSVTGQALQDAMQKQSWDPSVKALAAVPQALQMMSEKLDWTQRLGDAFLGQQADLLAAVQRLRQRAEAAGHLKSTDQQKVTRTAGGTAPVITIQSASPEEIFVPVYDPTVTYGAWPHAAYEPFYWHPPGYLAGNVFSFAAGVAVGSAVWGRVDWRRNRVHVDVDRFNRFNRTSIVSNSWRHDLRHRGNVPYRDSGVARRFGKADRAAAREAFRGRAAAGRRDLARAARGGRVATTGIASKRTAVTRATRHARSNIAVKSSTVQTRRAAAGTGNIRRTGAARRTTTVRSHTAIRGGSTHGFRAAGVRRGGFRGGRRR